MEKVTMDTIRLLRKAQAQFQFYAQEHLRKSTDAPDERQAATSRDKSDVNLFLAEEIERHLLQIHNETHPLQGLPGPVTPNDILRSRSRAG